MVIVMTAPHHIVDLHVVVAGAAVAAAAAVVAAAAAASGRCVIAILMI